MTKKTLKNTLKNTKIPLKNSKNAPTVFHPKKYKKIFLGAFLNF